MQSSDNDHESDQQIHPEVGNTEGQASHSEAVASYKVLTFNGSVPENFQSFIIATWLNSLRHGNDMFKFIDSDSYYLTYSRYIEKLLGRPTGCLKVAVLSEDEDTALGWSFSEGETLHYVFVKELKEWSNGKRVGVGARRKGIGSSLIPSDIRIFTHVTRSWLKVWNNKYPKMRFNPFL